ncbi:helix-turn-helix transcriptional regulator [Polynucleobacter cosmopolitanus]|uniref:helix-turn-helix transcriptional regulator n=1 Tax=Polynucleobacter cosmopolitanus TaxID=351345 RepID=UPI0015DBADC7|nr:helix-turn-helix transcriptional regulator [Polynucleobacter cosmopolitanus]
MRKYHKKLPLSNIVSLKITDTKTLGELLRAQRKALGLTQLDMAGVGNSGNRFIVELEAGKPTVQFQKTLDTLNLLGLEMVIREKTSGDL